MSNTQIIQNMYKTFHRLSNASKRDYHSLYTHIPTLLDDLNKLKVRNMKGFENRCETIPYFGFCIPDMDTMENLVSLLNKRKVKTILSIGAGVAFVETILQCISIEKGYGFSVIATDPYTSHNTNKNQPFMPVYKCTATQAIKFSNADTILTSWPAMEDWTHEALIQAREGNFTTAIYIGEGKGGCTGTDDFHQELSDNWNDADPDTTIGFYKPWYGLNDTISVYSAESTQKN